MCPAPVITMGRSGVVAVVLAMVAVVGATVGDNTLDGGDRIVLVAPVLAPPKDSRTHATDRARQFPILVLLAPQNPPITRGEPSAKSLNGPPHPIYVQVNLQIPATRKLLILIIVLKGNIHLQAVSSFVPSLDIMRDAPRR